MRKIVAVFIALSIIMIFAACKNKKEEPDYSVSPATTTTQAQETTSADLQLSTTDLQAAQMTYVLTTSPDKTVPWQNTTRFETVPVSLTQPEESTSMDVTLTTDLLVPPSVNSDFITTDWTTAGPPTAPPGFTNITTTASPSITTAPTTTEKMPTTTTTVPTTTTTQPTTVEKTAKTIAIDSSGYNSNTNCIILDVSADGWSSDFKGTTKDITVVVDGQSLTAPCKIPSTKNADGRYEVSINLSELGISSGSTVSYTISEGIIQTKAGTQYNSAYTGSCDVG